MTDHQAFDPTSPVSEQLGVPLAADLTELGISSGELRSLFGSYPSGVSVITANSAVGPVAMTVSSLSSVSADPPLLVFSASESSSSTPALRRSQTLVVHLVDEESFGVAALGAARGVNRFAESEPWSVLPTGEPYFISPKRRIRGRVVLKVEAGTATLFVVHALQSWIDTESAPGRPLVYHDRTWHALDLTSKLGPKRAD